MLLKRTAITLPSHYQSLANLISTFANLARQYKQELLSNHIQNEIP